MTVSVIIPTLNAEPWLPMLFDALERQRPRPPNEILVVDSMSADRTRELAAAWPRARVLVIERFTHGGARNLGVRAATSELVVLITQDALPADERWLDRLIAPFVDPSVAAVCSRQIPRKDADEIERFYLARSFPPGPPEVRRLAPGRRPGPADIFFSNVSAAYRREVLLRHPFDERLIMCEDQQAARDLLLAGHAIVYEPASVVIHSHRYTAAQTFRRYFDSAVAMRQLFGDGALGGTARTRLRFLAEEAAHMLRRPAAWPRYVVHQLVRSTATLLGHHAPCLPRRWVRRWSMHRGHWEPIGESG